MTEKTRHITVVPWSIREAVLWIVVWQLLLMSFFFLANFFWEIAHYSLPPELVAMLAASMALLVILSRWLKWKELRWSDLGTQWPYRRISAMAYLLAAILLAVVVGRSGIESPLMTELVRKALLSPVGKTVLLLQIGLMSPVVEEILFRGLLQSSCARSMGKYLAILVSVISFFLVHAPQISDSPWTAAPVLATGLLLSTAFAWRNSLTLCILIHSACNMMLLSMGT